MVEYQKCGRCKLDVPLEDYSPSYRGTRGTWCRSCFAAYARGERVEAKHEPRVCSHCGGEYVPKQLKDRARYCSRQCKHKAKHDRERRELLAAKPVDRQCEHCGKTLPQSMRIDAKFCSSDCNHAAHNLWRKLAKRTGGTRWEPKRPQRVKIADRDGWRCGICGGRIAKWRKHPDPLALSIDHIMALANGGNNAMENLQASHLRCNLSKRAT